MPLQKEVVQCSFNPQTKVIRSSYKINLAKLCAMALSFSGIQICALPFKFLFCLLGISLTILCWLISPLTLFVIFMTTVFFHVRPKSQTAIKAMVLLPGRRDCWAARKTRGRQEGRKPFYISALSSLSSWLRDLLRCVAFVVSIVLVYWQIIFGSRRRNPN